MVTIVYCTRESNPEHQEHLIKSSGLHKNVEVIEIINNGTSLTKSYNEGLAKASGDIVVFCHDDIIIETKQWGHKLLKIFEKHPDYGILGVAGSKALPTSGKWWENPKKMYGRVAHTHEGKTWLSSYSEDLGQDIEEVVTVDGVFFAVDKNKLKTGFNEAVEGFHFYDITFCFENYLQGVKIGVLTNIRINHQSIGMTNEAWEANRAAFAEIFKDSLPVNIKKVLRKGEKLKVLIACLSFVNFTGSELYVFELAKQLVKEGCDVSICSTLGNPMAAIAKTHGIKLFSLQEPPNYKLGDGKWLLKTHTGDVPSQKDTLYKFGEGDFDVIHCNHYPVTEHILKLYPNIPAISSIHSEVINLENPVISPQIKKYIAIRPEIKEHIVKAFGIDPEMVDVIYNPIDTDRFKPSPKKTKNPKKQILFVGTIDYLRKQAIQDLIYTTKDKGEELVIVGKKNETYLDAMIEGQSHVKYFPPTPNIQNFIHECDETAGILLGRTTIEGWMCGKKGWIYNVDETGNMLGKKLYDIPSDVDKFKADNVVKEIIKEYESILE